ncbi:MAG: glycosyltransferase family 87 protein [Planctomycetota bacterium]|nr:glycosyltransferase family 87 protein [Planctomycetota bacterium]
MGNSWLNEERLSRYPRIFATLHVAIWGFFMLTGANLMDRTGKPIGSDFLLFYTASTMALRGETATSYDFTRFYETQRTIIPADYPNPWVYPPVFLLFILPLGLLPYLASFLAWVSTNLALYLVTLRRIAPHPFTLWIAFGYPGTFQNLMHGQNGLLIASLMGGGLLLLPQSPVWAGVLFGLLVIKPHMAVMLVVALVAGRHWKALTATFLAACLLMLISLAVFGLDPWRAFFGNLELPVQILQTESSLWKKMVTTYSGFRLLGLDHHVAMGFQVVVSLTAMGTLGWIWSHQASHSLKASSLCIAVLLFTPYGYNYDLGILGLAIAYSGWETYREHWSEREKLPLVAAWLLPLLAPACAMSLRLSIAPFILLWFLTIVFRRTRMPVAAGKVAAS